jgi:hypothetical protein
MPPALKDEHHSLAKFAVFDSHDGNLVAQWWLVVKLFQFDVAATGGIFSEAYHFD